MTNGTTGMTNGTTGMTNRISGTEETSQINTEVPDRHISSTMGRRFKPVTRPHCTHPGPPCQLAQGLSANHTGSSQEDQSLPYGKTHFKSPLTWKLQSQLQNHSKHKYETKDTCTNIKHNFLELVTVVKENFYLDINIYPLTRYARLDPVSLLH